jgi:hypothetical protein
MVVSCQTERCYDYMRDLVRFVKDLNRCGQSFKIGDRSIGEQPTFSTSAIVTPSSPSL